MSRIGRLPITVPAGVTVTVDSNNLVTVKGPKGTLSQQVNHAITVNQEGNTLHLTRANDNKENRAMHGLYRALVHNMVVGVTDGFSKTLELAGVADIRTKSFGTNNPINMVKATLEALKQLRSAEQVAKMRGKTVEELLG